MRLLEQLLQDGQLHKKTHNDDKTYVSVDEFCILLGAGGEIITLDQRQGRTGFLQEIMWRTGLCYVTVTEEPIFDERYFNNIKNTSTEA